MVRSFDLAIAAITDAGKRKPENEDCILANTGENRFGKFGIFMVADGVGGTDLGKEASRMASEEMNLWWDENLPALLTRKKTASEISRDLKAAAESVNLKIYAKSREKNRSMASTFSALLIINDQAELLHMGDSRIYRIRNRSIIQMTEDHTWVAAQVKKGLLSLAEAEMHEKKHAVTRCLGHQKSSEFYEDTFQIMAKDFYLLCSDGFYEYCGNQLLLAAFLDSRDDKKGLEEILAGIYAKGASDNISAIAVRVGNPNTWWRK